MIFVKIMRGIQGIGKSTYVENNFQTAQVFSTDKYFFLDGVFKYDKAKLQEAHLFTLKLFLSWLAIPKEIDKDWIAVIDNTNIPATSIAPYYQTALACGCNVEIINLVTENWATAHGRNVHGVDLAQVRRMHFLQFEEENNFPTWWKVKTILV